MKSFGTFALVVLSCVPAMAQFGGLGTPGHPGARQRDPNIDVEILELEQDADKAALKEALSHQARLGMKPAPDTEPEQKRRLAEISTLREFIAKKKDVIKARAEELAQSRAARITAGASSGPKTDRKSDIEKSTRAAVEVRLLQSKLVALDERLSRAISELAKAETEAPGSDKAIEARKEYDKIKALYAEQSTQLQLEQQAAGMGSGFR